MRNLPALPLRAIATTALAVGLASAASWLQQSPLKETPIAVSAAGSRAQGVLPLPSNALPARLPASPDLGDLLQYRLVDPNLSALEGLEVGEVSQIEFSFFPGQELVGNVEYIEHTFLGGLAFWGKLSESNPGWFVGTLYGDHLTVCATSVRAGVLMVYPIGSELHAIRHSYHDAPLRCGTKPPTSQTHDAEPESEGSEDLTIGGADIDGVYLYTPRFLRWLESEFIPNDPIGDEPIGTDGGGGGGGLIMAIALSRLSEARTNMAFTNSGDTNAHFTLRGHELWDVDDGPHWDTANEPLSDFLNGVMGGSGAFELVHEVRDCLGVDTIGVFTGIADPGTAGIANLNDRPWHNDDAFHVFGTSAQVITGLTVTHELGHNLGCTHDRHATGNSEDGQAEYSNGHYWMHPGVSHSGTEMYGTVMSYVRQYNGPIPDPNFTGDPGLAWPPEHDVDSPSTHPTFHGDDDWSNPDSEDDTYGRTDDPGEHTHTPVRIPHFSNPGVSFTIPGTSTSYPTGVSINSPNSADNAATINTTANHIAAINEYQGTMQTVWMDPEGGHNLGWESGTEDEPYDTMLEAVMRVSPGGTIKIKAGGYPRRIGFSKAVHLEVPEGTARLGEE